MPETLPYVTVPDGLPHGSRILTIDAVAYIANSFQPRAPTKQLTRTTHLGAPNGFKLLRDRKVASAVLQLDKTTTAIPGRGREFAGEAVDNVAAWVIIDVGAPEEAEGLKTVTIECWEKI